MSRSSTEGMGTPEELFHWIPGEMVVVVRLPQRPADDEQDILLEQVRSQLNALLTQYNLFLESYGTYGRWSDIPTMPPVRRRSFIFGLHPQQSFAAIFFHARSTDHSTEDPVPLALSSLQAHLEQLAQVGLHVVSAMPNWLVTAAPAPLFYAEGGPAFPPRPAPKLDLPSVGNAPVGWHVSFADSRIPLDPNDAEGVMVAVLDTAPHPDRLRNAAARPEFRRNRLLQRLASDLKGEKPAFEIEYDRRYYVTNDVRTGRNDYNDARYYPIPDHGLFVAGLIRDVAPRVRLRLVRILNDFGGGDLYNLFAALTDLEHELVAGSIRGLVINLSLTVMPDIRRLPYVWFDRREWPSTQLAGVMRVLTHIEEGLRVLFESLYAQGALVVAAAGNDSWQVNQEGLPPRPPRAPARYKTTLGVASVNSGFMPSVFANAASLPALCPGVATFGGGGYEAIDVNGLPDAVRGVYISSTFPAGEQNTSGWADWSGSSFATSIMSGLGAHLLAQRWSAPDIITRLASASERRTSKLFGASPGVPSLLANLVRVQQRFEE